MFNIGVLTSTICNKNCEYCVNCSENNHKDADIVFDLDYFNWVLEQYIHLGIKDIQIELSGGEPGLLSNFMDVISYLKSNEYVKSVMILSNGLVRERFGKSFVEALGEKFSGYYEHADFDINKKYDEDWINYIIVVDEALLDKLLELNIDNKYPSNVHFKSFTPKDTPVSKEYIDKLQRLSPKTYTYIKDILNYRENDKLKKKLCAKISPFQFIDIQNKIIGSCSMNVEKAMKFPITKENIQRAVMGELFKQSDYCKNICYKYDYFDLCFMSYKLRKDGVFVNCKTVFLKNI